VGKIRKEGSGQTHRRRPIARAVPVGGGKNRWPDGRKEQQPAYQKSEATT